MSKVSAKSLNGTQRTCINVSDVQFNTSVWFTTDIDLFVAKSNLKLLTIFLSAHTPGERTYLHIRDCSIGSPLFVINANATFERCSFYHLRSDNTSFISAIYSTIKIQSSTIEQFEGQWFLHYLSGVAQLIDVVFASCSSTKALVGVYNESVLIIDSCMFLSNNHSLIYIKTSSLGIIRNSNFSHNVVLNSTSVHFLVRSTHGSGLMMTMCHFYNNTLVGTAVSFVDKCIGIVETSTFTFNKCRAIDSYSRSYMVIRRCIFHRNMEYYGAAISLQQQKQYLTSDKLKVGNTIRTFLNKYLDTQNCKMIFDVGSVPQFVQSTCTIHKCTFTENNSKIGGAIYAHNMSLIIRASVFMNNSAMGSSLQRAGYGGAICLQNCHTNVTGSSFSGNKANFGGGIAQELQSVLYIDSSTFTNNTALEGVMGHGGAILESSKPERSANSTTLFISNCTFCNNKASDSAGAIFTGLSISIRASKFHLNSARTGGAMWSRSGHITNCDFVSNSAQQGGGAMIFSINSRVNISHSNFTNNIADAGGAILGTQNSSLVCRFCLFCNNTAGHK